MNHNLKKIFLKLKNSENIKCVTRGYKYGSDSDNGDYGIMLWKNIKKNLKKKNLKMNPLDYSENFILILF